MPRRSSRGSPPAEARVPAPFSVAVDNQPQRVLVVVRVRHLLVTPARPVVLTDVSIWMVLAHPIDPTMDLALGRPALAVGAGAPISMIILMGMVMTTTSTRKRSLALSRPLISVCSSNLARF